MYDALEDIPLEKAAAIFAADDAVAGKLHDDPRYVRSGFRTPAGMRPCFEVWIARRIVATGNDGGIRFAADDHEIIAHIEAVEDSDVAQCVEATYLRLIATVVGCGFSHLVRFWNFIPQLNQGVGDAERYKQFCIGRGRALQPFATRYMAPPAASCVGRVPGAISICVLASKSAALSCENPRQISAFRYPRRYGPVAPEFSRSMILQRPEEDLLLAAGTASIVGHETRHVGDPVAQTRETLANLHAVVQRANERRLSAAHFPTYAPANLRVYVRSAEDAPAIRSAVESFIAPAVRPLYAVADICRADLLVEIEGAWEGPARSCQ